MRKDGRPFTYDGTYRSGVVEHTKFDGHGRPIAFIRPDDTSLQNLFMTNHGEEFGVGDSVVFRIRENTRVGLGQKDIASGVMSYERGRHLLGGESPGPGAAGLSPEEQMRREIHDGYCGNSSIDLNCGVCPAHASCGGHYPVVDTQNPLTGSLLVTTYRTLKRHSLI